MLNKPKKAKTIKDEDWGKTSIEGLSPSEALEGFYRLKAEEKRQSSTYKLKILSLQLAAQVCSGGDAVYDIVPVAKEIYNFLQEISDDEQ